MPHLRPLREDEVSPDVRAIYAEIEQEFGGRVPNLFKTYAHHPPLLKANWDKVKATLNSGQLSPKLKQTIAVLVSQANRTQYCVKAHSRTLLTMGLGETDLAAILQGHLAAVGFSDREIKLVELMLAVNADANGIPDGTFQQIKALGISEAELVEAYGVMELFVAFNKFLDSLEVEFED